MQRPPAAQVWRRLPRLLFGLVLCGVGIAALVRADLGLGPWDVLHQGLSELTGLSIGVITIVVGLVVLAGWIPLGEQLGIGTLLNVIVIGITVDATLLVLDTPEPLWGRTVMMAAGPVLFAVGSGFYIGAGLGPGPRDGLMTGWARRGHPVHLVRLGIEVVVLGLGWMLGGAVGIGTVVFAFGIGPLVQLALKHLSIDPVDPIDTVTGAR